MKLDDLTNVRPERAQDLAQGKVLCPFGAGKPQLSCYTLKKSHLTLFLSIGYNGQ